MPKFKTDSLTSSLPGRKKVSVELDFYQIDDLLKSHFDSFKRKHYEKKDGLDFSEYLNLTNTLMVALSFHPVLKQQDNQ